jgi:hypothetical protein
VFGHEPELSPEILPLENTSPLLIAGTVAVEMIGPTPGTVIALALSSCRTIAHSVMTITTGHAGLTRLSPTDGDCDGQPFENHRPCRSSRNRHRSHIGADRSAAKDGHSTVSAGFAQAAGGARGGEAANLPLEDDGDIGIADGQDADEGKRLGSDGDVGIAGGIFAFKDNVLERRHSRAQSLPVDK